MKKIIRFAPLALAAALSLGSVAVMAKSPAQWQAIVSQSKVSLDQAMEKAAQAVAGKVIGPSFSASEVPDVIEAVLTTYRSLRDSGETFQATVRRTGLDPFKEAAKLARHPAKEALATA